MKASFEHITSGLVVLSAKDIFLKKNRQMVKCRQHHLLEMLSEISDA